jgi:hypothetical protein
MSAGLWWQLYIQPTTVPRDSTRGHEEKVNMLTISTKMDRWRNGIWLPVSTDSNTDNWLSGSDRIS